MPWLLKIICCATTGIGLLQLLSLFFPVLSPGIDGKVLSSIPLVILMSGIHISIGLAILAQKKPVIPAVIVLPLIQYGVLYLEFGSPTLEEFRRHLITSAFLSGFLACYLILTNAKKYFQGNQGV